MIATKINAEHMRKRGYSADSIAVNLGVTIRQLEQIERAPVQAMTEPTQNFSRCGELA